MPRILVVEDDADLRDTLASVLEEAGYEVAQAESGPDALARLTPMPDLILLDLTLPEMDGRVVRAELERRPELATVPILTMTAHRAPDVHLRKPIALDKLLATVEAALRSGTILH